MGHKLGVNLELVITVIGSLAGATLAGFFVALRRLSLASYQSDQVLERKYADLQAKFTQLEDRFHDESTRRRAAELKLDELSRQRQRDQARQKRAIQTLRAKLLDQRAQIESLHTKIERLEQERDDLRRQRDDARAEQAALTARLEAANQRLSKAEAQISSMQVKEKAFELLFSRLNLGITINNPEVIKESAHA